MINKKKDVERESYYLWNPSRFCSWTSIFHQFINYLQSVVERSEAHHYADDANLLLTSILLKTMNKHIYGIKAVLIPVASRFLKGKKSKTCYLKVSKKKTNKTKVLNISSKDYPHKRSQMCRSNSARSSPLEYTSFEPSKKWERSFALLLYTLRAEMITAEARLFLNSHVIYCCEIWGQNYVHLQKILKNPIEKQQ